MLYFVEHAPVDPVRMTYSNGYQNARTGVGSKVLVFIRPCDPLWVHRGVFHKIACDFYFETEQVIILCAMVQVLQRHPWNRARPIGRRPETSETRERVSSGTMAYIANE